MDIKDAAFDAVSEHVVYSYTFTCPYCNEMDWDDAERRSLAEKWAEEHFRECELSPFYERP